MNLEEVKYAEEVSSIKTHKTFWFLVFALIFIIIIASLFLIFTSRSSDKVSSKQLIQGASLDLGENDSVGFNFGNEEHGIKINFVGFDSAGVTIFSEPISFVLELNEAKYIDVDNDGINDIKVKLISIENGIATVVIQRMFVVLCDEKWNCSEWRECSNGKQTRICKDLNECETSEDKPSELRTCLKIEFAEGDNTGSPTNNSVNNTVETGNLNNATNADNLTNKTNTTINNSANVGLNNTPLNTTINCGYSSDYSCFINALRNCTPAIWNFSSSYTGSTPYPIIHYEIKGESEEGRCIYYEKYLEQNNEKICKINTDELTAIVTGWFEGGFSTENLDNNAECYLSDNFNCKLNLVSGSLQGIRLYLSSGGSMRVMLLVQGYSDTNKVTWRAENSSVIKLEPVVGNYSTISPLHIGETFVIIKDTSLASCELRIPFEVYGNNAALTN